MVAKELKSKDTHTHKTKKETAFAALRADGSVVTWGCAGGGGDSRLEEGFTGLRVEGLGFNGFRVRGCACL